MKNKIFFTVFMLIWIILIVLNFVIKSNEFSEQENRYLARIPSFSFEKLVNGDFQQDMESYINDHFIFRNFWIKLKSVTEMVLRKNRK